MPYVAVGVGALLGANVRYVISVWAAERWGAGFPFGTFIINISGAFVIGLFLAAVAARTGAGPLIRLFVVTGFLGGYTTFSSYAWEALALASAATWARFGVYVVGSNLLGLAGVWLGARIGSVFA